MNTIKTKSMSLKMVVFFGLVAIATSGEAYVTPTAETALSASGTCSCTPIKCKDGSTISCSATNTQGGVPSCTCEPYLVGTPPIARVSCQDKGTPPKTTTYKCEVSARKIIN